MEVGFLRSNLDKTMEFNSMLNITRQGDSAPLTMALRAGIEARNNFQGGEQLVQPSAFIEPVFTHTVKDGVSFVVAPIFAFNTRNETTPTELMIDPDHNNTIALGIGTGIRLFPSVSLVGEVIPRLRGFKGVVRDRPGFSLGLQKSTFRHTFEFVLSRQESLTTNQTAVQAGRFGNDTFRIGFNIYRKIRLPEGCPGCWEPPFDGGSQQSSESFPLHPQETGSVLRCSPRRVQARDGRRMRE
jgi:hypothetical protein